MPLIRNQRFFPSREPLPRQALLMCGYGGSIWQARRLVRTLNRAGYDVTALDFPKSVLRSGDVTQLPQLTNEVVEFAEQLAREAAEPVLLVGISLGALLSLNILRRSQLFDAAVLITGGDIAKIAKRIYPRAWPQPYDELAQQWRDINMYTDPALLRGKRMLFVLHPSRKLIDITDVRTEIARQRAAGNHMFAVERPQFDHVGTIVAETILFPHRTLTYIDQVKPAARRA